MQLIQQVPRILKPCARRFEEADYIDLITCPVKGYDEHHNLIGFEYNVVTVKDSEFVSLGAYATPVK